MMLKHAHAPEDYIPKLTGMILDSHSVGELKELVQDREELRERGRKAYDVLMEAGWNSAKDYVNEEWDYPRKFFEDDLYTFLCRESKFSKEMASRLVETVLHAGDESHWRYWRDYPDEFLKEAKLAMKARVRWNIWIRKRFGRSM